MFGLPFIVPLSQKVSSSLACSHFPIEVGLHHFTPLSFGARQARSRLQGEATGREGIRSVVNVIVPQGILPIHLLSQGKSSVKFTTRWLDFSSNSSLLLCVVKKRKKENTQPTTTTSTSPEAPQSSQGMRLPLRHLLCFPKLQARAGKWRLGDPRRPAGGTRLARGSALQPRGAAVTRRAAGKPP